MRGTVVVATGVGGVVVATVDTSVTFTFWILFVELKVVGGAVEVASVGEGIGGNAVAVVSNSFLTICVVNTVGEHKPNNKAHDQSTGAE